jgi:hypothetical protein
MVEASKSTVQVAEPFTVTVSVNVPATAKVRLPQIIGTLGTFDVGEQKELLDVPLGDGTRQWSLQLTLESIITGEQEVPALEIQVLEAGQNYTLRSQPVAIRVASLLEDRADPTRFRDIRSLVDLPIPQASPSPRWLWWSAAAVVSGLVIAAALLVASRVRSKRSLAPARWAQRQLEALSDSDRMRQGDAEAVTTELSAVLRNYLQLELKLNAPALTTPELLASIDDRGWLTASELSQFRGLCEAADLAKFAGLRLSQPEMQAAIDRARVWIEAVSRELPHRTAAPSSARN